MPAGMLAAGGRFLGWLVILAGCFTGWASAAEAELVEAVPRIKPSIVAVGSFQPTRNPAFQFRGTGFVIGDGLTVATNAHVLPEVNAAQSEVLAIARLEEGRINVRSAARIAADPAHDVALVRLTGGGPLPALELAEDLTVREGEAVAFIGYPLGTALGMRPVTHRGIISAITPIGTPPARAQNLSANLVHRLAASFEILQLDATAYPGNSGSPLFDIRSGKVVGVINMVFVKGAKENALSQPSGITYAIPAKHIRSLLEAQRGKN